MYSKKALLIAPTSMVLVLGVVTVIWACFGSPVPPSCPQTIYLAKFVPGGVVIPPGGASFTAPVGVLPFVSWDVLNPSSCAQPTAAEVTLEATCTPAGGGAAFTIAPQTFAVATPTLPGAQPVPGGSLPFVIPAGTPASTCTIMGTYSVTFGGGGGGGVLAGTGDTNICLIEPSREVETIPRVDIRQILLETAATPGLQMFHQGDQAYVFFRMENNDLSHTATFHINSEGRQIAGLADGFTDDATAYDNGVFRISNDAGDVFPADIFTDMLPFDRIPGDPLSDDPGSIESTFVLEPGEIGVFGMAINSFGACADGSCNERNINAMVDLVPVGGGDTEFADVCGQFAYLVDNDLPPAYPGLTILDEIKVHPEVDAQWGPLRVFDPDGLLLDVTHLGNITEDLILSELLPGPAIQTTGDVLQEMFPDIAIPVTNTEERITVTGPPGSAQFEVFLFDQRDNFIQEHNIVNIFGVDQLQEPCAVPAVTYLDNAPTDVTLNLFEGCAPDSPVEILIPGEPPQTVLLDDLRNNPPPNFKSDNETCRTVSLPEGNNLDAPVILPDPPFIVDSFFDTGIDLRDIQVVDQFGAPVSDGTATLDGPGGVTLASPDITDGMVSVEIDPSLMTPGLGIGEWHVRIEVPGSLNATAEKPLVVPLQFRRLITPTTVNVTTASDPLIQVGDLFEIDLTLSDSGDPLLGAECLIGIDHPDDLDFTLPDGSPFALDPFDAGTPGDEVDRLRDRFGGAEVDPCLDGSRRCATLALGDGEAFEATIFADGFDSSDASVWASVCAADNAVETTRSETPFGVLDADKRLPVITEEELRQAIELFNDDVVFEEKTIGLVSERFGILEPLPPARGTYFFDEFESFRKGAAAAVTLDGSGCASPCSGLVIEGDGGGVNGIRFENFPDNGVVLAGDGVLVTASAFAGNGLAGLRIEGSGHTVGGSLETGNVFTGNGGPGVAVASGTGNRITHNTFAGNGGLGIDLGDDGVTMNDDGDADGGANLLQNFPVITSALIANSTALDGTLDGAANTSFLVQFFAGDACDASDHGEGARFLGETLVATDATGNAAFSVTVDSTAAIGQFVTATATNDGTGDTSEFSVCFEVVSGVASEAGEEIPETYALFANYPNPFNPVTTIRYAVPKPGRVRLAVYDVLGREVALLVDAVKAPGTYDVVFDARGLPSGAYLYRMRGEGFVATRSLTVLK
ncbi:right-handed parallel beta-helix repeat-containing protein [Rhodocaloribacter sp.]